MRNYSAWNSESDFTFGFASVLPEYAASDPQYSGFSTFNPQQQAMTLLALSAWSDVADVAFHDPVFGAGQINFANSSTLSEAVAGHAFGPGFSSWHSDVWINSTIDFNINPEIGNRGHYTLLHEIGHTIGLEHPGDYEAADGPVNFHSHAGSHEDTFQYSIMSYFSETHSGADFGGFFGQTPMLNDIAIIQERYGANLTTRSGDTVYGFNDNTGSVLFDFTVNQKPALSIWDAGGTDTLDVSGFFQDATVNLIAGEFSSVAGMTDNLSIARGAEIENTVTGSGNDTIIGNASDNLIDGGTGSDTFVLALPDTDVQLVNLDTGLTILHSVFGTDQLTNIETIEFSTDAVSVADLPVKSVLEYGASHSDLIAALGANETALFEHLLTYGLYEGRSIDFSGLDYIAAHSDLQLAFGADATAGARHYIEHGHFEGRDTGVPVLGIEANEFAIV